MRPGADDQERTLETSLVKMVVLLKQGVGTPGQKELLPWGCEEELIMYLGVGGRENRWFSKELSSAKEDLQDMGGLVIVKVKVVFSPSKALP